MVWEFERPIVVAPMAGGPSTPGLVTAAAVAGAVGFLAAGYQAPDAVAQEVAELRASRLPFGLNIFVPSPRPAGVAPLEAIGGRCARKRSGTGSSCPRCGWTTMTISRPR